MVEKNEKLLNQILDKLKKGDPMRVSLPGKGILKMDKPVPFLIVYRIPPDGKDNFTYNLGRTESSYLITPESKKNPIEPFIKIITNYLADHFGSFVLVEVWLSRQIADYDFTIHLNQKGALSMSTKLTDELSS